MGIIDIINGHVNEATGKNKTLSDERMAICEECPLYIHTVIGPLCNSDLYINIENKIDVSPSPKAGYRRGCNCRLAAKTSNVNSKCIVNKW